MTIFDWAALAMALVTLYVAVLVGKIQATLVSIKEKLVDGQLRMNRLEDRQDLHEGRIATLEAWRLDATVRLPGSD